MIKHLVMYRIKRPKPLLIPTMQAPEILAAKKTPMDMTFSPDGSTVIFETHTVPRNIFIDEIRQVYPQHYMNLDTATCWFVLKDCGKYIFPVHWAYLAGQSIYFRTIFER